MRGLWTVALLAPAIAWADSRADDTRDQDITSKTINVPLPATYGSPDTPTSLIFRIDVLPSDYICGYGNLTINGQELVQKPSEVASVGNGPIDVDGQIVEGFWSFSCLYGFYGPYAQRLDFSIVSVDDQDVEDVGFWVDFKQNDKHRIFSTSAMDDDSTLWEGHSDSEISPSDDSMDDENFDLERELAELAWMKDLVQDLKSQIYLKERAIAVLLSEENFDACDSVKCVIRTVYNKARVAAHNVIVKVYSKLSGDLNSEQDMRPPWKKPHGRNPHRGKPHFPAPSHGNHSHGNHTCPGKGNHTHPPFHPRPPPPFCHCPSLRPPHGHKPPHRFPPHGPPSHGSPHHDPPKGPPSKQLPPPPPPPPPHKVHSKPSGGPPDYQPGLPDGKLHDSPLSPSESDQDQSSNGPFLDDSLLDSPKFAWRLHRVNVAAKFFAVAILLILLVFAIHRRCCCSAARRQEKKARREERRRRRAFRRAAKRQAWKSWFARRFLRSKAQDGLEDEEKRTMLEGQSQSSEIDSDTVASEISAFRNAASVVSDIIAAEEGRMEGRISMESRSTLPEYMSEVGGERLPSYEIEERSELSSVVADGFRYTLGRSEYTPGSSESGSIRDILGDVKD